MLIEREAELGALSLTLAESRAGLSSAAVVDGVVGTGKTALIKAAAQEALADGMVVLRPADPASAGWVRLGADGRQSFARSEAVAGLDCGGLVVCLDDGHGVGLREIQRVRRLMESVSPRGVALLVARDPARDLRYAHLDSFVLRLAKFRRIRVGVLSRAGTAGLMARQLNGAGHDIAALSEKFHEIAGGNPLLLGALVQEQLDPEGHARAVPAPRGLFTQVVLDCLQRSGGEVADTALGIAVLAEQATAELVARLTGLVPNCVERCLQLLQAAGVVQGCAFRHPLVAETVLRSADAARIGELHRIAASLLHMRAAHPAVIARHLMAVGRVDEPWGAGVLRDAAGQALARNDAHAALWALNLAREGADGPLRTALEVGTAIVTCRLNPSAGEQALRAVVGAPQRTTVVRCGGPVTTERPSPGSSGLGIVDRHAEEWWDRVLLYQQRATGDGGPYPASSGIRTAWLESRDGVDEDTVRRVQRRLGTTPLTDATVPELLNDIRILVIAERAHEALRHARGFTQGARRMDAPGWQAMFDAVAAEAALAGGDFAEAARHAACAAEVASPRIDSAFAISLRASRILAHTRMGEYKEAALLLAPPVPDHSFGGIDSLGFLRARGHHLLATGRPEGALACFLRAGERAEELGADRPALMPWRLDAVDVLLRLGDRGRAGALLAEQRRARGVRRRHVRGAILRLESHFADPERRIELLRRSITELSGSADRYELARATGDLAGAYADTGEEVKAWIARRRAWRYAKECRALALCEELLPGLDLQDTDMERIEGAAFDQLSGSELRVAILAGRGYTNREIAAQLSVTVSTVEQHLTRVYRKLDIAGRKALAATYAGRDVAVRRTRPA